MTGPARLDPGTRHVLAWCVECPPWRVLAADRAAAHVAAADHVARVHGNAAAAKHHKRLAADMHKSG